MFNLNLPFKLLKQTNFVNNPQQENTDEEINNDTLIKDIKKTGTYKRLLNLIVDEALGNLPRDITDVLGYDFISVFKEALIYMREQGIAFCYYDGYRLFFDTAIKVKEVKKDTTNLGEKFAFNIGNKPLPYNQIIVFGDLLNQNKGEFITDHSSSQSILMYENALIKFFSKIDDAHAWIFKIKDYNESSLVKNKQSQAIKEKTKKIANRTSKSVVILDKEDDFTNTQLDLNWFSGYLHEYKSKICLDYSVPFTKLFGEVASGLNSTGEGDRKAWYDTVRAFQIIYIFEALKKYAELKGKTQEFINIKMEQLDSRDRESDALINNNKINSIIAAVSTGLLEDEQAQQLISEILGLTAVVDRSAKGEKY
ncbi:DUF1073 domain-containing protein [Candidatus Hepatincolaceae symbiont of Richtersius coronifer]